MSDAYDRRDVDDQELGLPASELSDEDLERQGLRAHATRHWVFLHGTAEQYRTHTRRMLELEEEYLRRHPQRTWQGSGGSSAAAGPLARDMRIRDLLRTLTAEIERLLDEDGVVPAASGGRLSDEAPARLLAAFDTAPGGRMHKLEAHQVARAAAPDARLVASLYRCDPPLLRAEGDDRVITEAGRAWLADRRP